MTRREFERLVQEAVKALPESFRARIERVVIRVAESPSKRQSRVPEPKSRREPALYGKHLTRWLDHFPRAAFCVIDYTETAHNLPGVLGRLYRFLDLPDQDADAHAGVTMR